ncbi:class I SAM-dependent methyltransferase [Tumidithrix elongata RA019]|uniref:Class I SAM-dependent methyltransferase n=1 Tax=Tumidithrix elongata BACA0141 TaxID=2716417 RepID=A0AAW9PXF0_9CYAN|nr:class I SAM-dependent methyltransferase [Tumidithrix elongata RA019]
MTIIHKHFADNTSEHSVATQLRRQRFDVFMEMLKDLPRPVKILDIGGSQGYWEMMADRTLLDREFQITLLNIENQAVSIPSFTAAIGDGRAMPEFADKQFDIVFSNSTIEHVGSFEDQKRMADEVRRVGKRYYIQTPNLFFPVEPHFVFPLFQFFPIAFRAWLLQHFDLGWYTKIPDYQKALHEVKSIRLLHRAEFKQLFPEAIIFEEKFYGMVKSFVSFTP